MRGGGCHGGRHGRVSERQGMMVGDRLELQGLLLRVVGGKNLIEDDECAVAISGREHEALAVG